MIVQVVQQNDSWDVREVWLGTASGSVQGAVCVDDRIVACWRRHQREYQGWCLLGAEGQKALAMVPHEHLRWHALWRRLGAAVK